VAVYIIIYVGVHVSSSSIKFRNIVDTSFELFLNVIIHFQ
jgi:hypothetical protein